MKRFKVGDKVKVYHGTGVVVGFERFDSKGFSAPMADIQSETGEERIVIQLDEGHTWMCNDVLYYGFNHETFKIEFMIGETVTFQAYSQNEPLKREVINLTDSHPLSGKDGRIVYHLGSNGVVTNVTTSDYIVESENFKL